MTRNLDHEFDELVDTCYTGLPKDSSQYKEMRMVWFAAMFLLMREFMNLAELPDALAEKGLKMLDDQINTEVNKLKKKGEAKI